MSNQTRQQLIDMAELGPHCSECCDRYAQFFGGSLDHTRRGVAGIELFGGQQIGQIDRTGRTPGRRDRRGWCCGPGARAGLEAIGRRGASDR